MSNFDQNVNIKKDIEKEMIKFLEEKSEGLILVGRVVKKNTLYTVFMFNEKISLKGQEEIKDVLSKYI